MKEERMAILRMVAEGKISADEAETLLEALGASEETTEGRRQHRHRRHRGPRPPRPPRPPRGIGRFAEDMEHFAEGLAESISESVQEGLGSFDDEGDFFREGDFFKQEFDASPQNLTIEPGTTLEVKTHSGALALFGTDEPQLKISGAHRRHYKIQQNGNRVQVKANRFGAALTIHIPRTVEQLSIKNHLGEIVARNLTASLKEIDIKSHTGSIALETGAIRDGKIWIKSHTGVIKVALSPQAACHVEAVADHMGEVETNLPLENLERGVGYLKGTLNGGGADIRLSTHTGRIQVEASTPVTGETHIDPEEDDFDEDDN